MNKRMTVGKLCGKPGMTRQNYCKARRQRQRKEADGGLTGQPVPAELTGEGSDAFTLSKTKLPSIKAGKSGKLVIAPVAGLDAGTYEAALVLSGDKGVAATLDVSYTVEEAAEAEATASEETTDEGDAVKTDDADGTDEETATEVSSYTVTFHANGGTPADFTQTAAR